MEGGALEPADAARATGASGAAGTGVTSRFGSVVDLDQHLAHRHEFSLGERQAGHRPRSWRGNLHIGLVRHQLDEDLVEFDPVADRDLPGDHLGLDHPLANIRKLEAVHL